MSGCRGCPSLAGVVVCILGVPIFGIHSKQSTRGAGREGGRKGGREGEREGGREGVVGLGDREEDNLEGIHVYMYTGCGLS